MERIVEEVIGKGPEEDLGQQQREAVQRVPEHIKKGRLVISGAPTGTGCTAVLQGLLCGEEGGPPEDHGEGEAAQAVALLIGGEAGDGARRHAAGDDVGDLPSLYGGRAGAMYASGQGSRGAV